MNPDAHTIQEFFLDVGDNHELYVQDWGNKLAEKPIIFLHGGPGSHSRDNYRNLFDPVVQRVIFFDQRGCGKSLPYGSLENNTTEKLIADIGKIADHLSINEFIITGGSWGSCLALAYAIEHPERVKAMVLHGIFTGSKSEIEWLDKGRFQTFFPEAWQRYLAATPSDYRLDPSTYHFKRILGSDSEAAKQSGLAYDNLEGSVMSLDDRFKPQTLEDYDPSGIKIEVSYMTTNCFMPDQYILDNTTKLTMPIWLVQGRYDNVCPPVTAYELNQKLPNSQLVWTVSGHKSEHESWNLQRTILRQLSQVL